MTNEEPTEEQKTQMDIISNLTARLGPFPAIILLQMIIQYGDVRNQRQFLLPDHKQIRKQFLKMPTDEYFNYINILEHYNLISIEYDKEIKQKKYFINWSELDSYRSQQ